MQQILFFLRNFSLLHALLEPPHLIIFGEFLQFKSHRFDLNIIGAFWRFFLPARLIHLKKIPSYTLLATASF